LVHQDRWPAVDPQHLCVTKDSILSTAETEKVRLSVVSILADHLHNAMGCHYTKSPEEIALSFLNNLSDAHEKKPLFQHGFYLGTFGEYDMGAIWSKLRANENALPT